MSRIIRLLNVVRTLGIGWLCFRVIHALQHKRGWFRYSCPQQDWPAAESSAATTSIGAKLRDRLPGPIDDFPTTPWADESRTQVIEDADQILAGSFSFYSCQRKQLGFPPNWHVNPFSGETIPDNTHWSRLGDFAFGDIKHVWETARFGSAVSLGRAYRLTQDERYSEGVWQLVEDWCEKNPPNSGVHWKCGQETTLRLLAILLATGFVKDSTASTTHRWSQIVHLAETSATRIAANLSYALSQKNNHGISEAAGLYIVGLLFPELPKSPRWKTLGKQKLEEQILELIEPGGGFAQHSLNYQRLTLHVLVLSLKVADDHGDTFSDRCKARICECVALLAALCDPQTGHVPVLGPNDGALLLPLSACDYRDFRPIVQTATALLTGTCPLPDGPWDEDCFWLGIRKPQRQPHQSTLDVPPAKSQSVNADGYLQMSAGHTTAFMRCPQRLKFRPHHSDQLHFELWSEGTNVLPDGGSYSYNDELMPYFRGVEAHNTVQFDERDQMPVLSRFLYGSWLTAEVRDSRNDDSKNSNVHQVTAGYQDYQGAKHCRIIEVLQDEARQPGDKIIWTVKDQISGFQRIATLRWRLNPKCRWTLTGNGCHSENCRIEIESDCDFDLQINTGLVSWYYSQKEPLPVLEVTTRSSPATLISRISFTAAG